MAAAAEDDEDVCWVAALPGWGSRAMDGGEDVEEAELEGGWQEGAEGDEHGEGGLRRRWLGG